MNDPILRLLVFFQRPEQESSLMQQKQLPQLFVIHSSGRES